MIAEAVLNISQMLLQIKIQMSYFPPLEKLHCAYYRKRSTTDARYDESDLASRAMRLVKFVLAESPPGPM
jgi:hypothetical protein